ncbi:MAG: hypothetical protein ACJ70N_03940, partial [Nitrososphaera sp.]
DPSFLYFLFCVVCEPSSRKGTMIKDPSMMMMMLPLLASFFFVTLRFHKNPILGAISLRPRQGLDKNSFESRSEFSI